MLIPNLAPPALESLVCLVVKPWSPTNDGRLRRLIILSVDSKEFKFPVLVPTTPSEAEIDARAVAYLVEIAARSKNTEDFLTTLWVDFQLMEKPEILWLKLDKIGRFFNSPYIKGLLKDLSSEYN